ncbi:MAG: SnoaL-like domain-containing protein [Fimbriimonadaceae bacterium]
MEVKDIAHDLVALCKEGKDREVLDKYYDENIVSVEAEEPKEFKGLEAVKGKHEWFENKFEVHGMEVEGPWVNEPYFIVKFTIDSTDKETGKRAKGSEYGVYEVKNGKIVGERFFY